MLSGVGQRSHFGRQSVFCGLHTVQMQQASMKTKDTTALKGSRAITQPSSTVGLISPDQDVCIPQGHEVHCILEASHLCDSASQQGLPNEV